MLDLRTSRGDRRSQGLERRGVTGISLQLRLVPTVQRQALASAREQLGRHPRRRERDAAALFEQAGDADAGRVEIEDCVEAQLRLQLREPPDERNLSRRRPAGNPDDQIVAVSNGQQVAEGLAVLDQDDAARCADERELDLVDLRRPQVALAVAERSAQLNDPVVLRDQLLERLAEQPLEQRAAAVGPGLGVVDLTGKLAGARPDAVLGQIGQPLRRAKDEGERRPVHPARRRVSERRLQRREGQLALELGA